MKDFLRPFLRISTKDSLKASFPLNDLLKGLLRHFLKGAAVLVGILTVGTLAFVLAFLKSPEKMLNSKNVEWIIRYALQHWVDPSLKLDWKTLEFRLVSNSFFKKSIDLNLRDLCFQSKSVEQESQGITVSGCSDSISLHLAADLSGVASLGNTPWLRFLPAHIDGGPIEVKNLKVALRFPEAGASEKPNLYGQVSLKGISTKPGKLYPFRVEAKVRLTKSPEEEVWGQRAPFVESDLNVMMEEATWTAQVSGKAGSWIPEIPEIKLKGCDFKVPSLLSSDARNKGGSVNTDCRVDVQLSRSIRSPIPIDIPRQIPINLHTQLAVSSFPPEASSKIHGPIDIKLLPIHASTMHLNGDIHTQISGTLAAIMSGFSVENSRSHLDGYSPAKAPPWRADTQFEIGAGIEKFGDLVKYLEKNSLKNWDPSDIGLSVIPAPFHVMNGAVELKLKGSGDLSSGSAVLDLKSQLKSQGQIFRIGGAGEFEVKHLTRGWIPRLKLDLLLDEVQLELPRLSLGVPPKFLPDSRITRTEQAQVEKERAEKAERFEERKWRSRQESGGIAASGDSSSFQYNITLRTGQGKPIRLLSHLVRTPVPVHLNLKLSSSAPFDGTIQVGEFPVQFFRRDALVQQFKLSLKSPMDESPIFGNVSVEYADYQVLIQLVGTIDKPQILLKSDPPLPENQIIAVLIFGRPLDELDSDQTASVGSTQAAITDGAISLASLYLLASTPIQSVNYDPSSGVVSAKVRLGDGMSLNLGRSKQESSIGIRKRIGQFWTIETDFSNSAPYGKVGSAYLEWSHRY